MGRSLEDKTVAVFGGSSGIGFAVAGQALAAGARVTILSRDPARLAAASSRLDRADTFALDVRDAAAVAAFFAARPAFDHVVVSAAQLSVGPLRQRRLEDERAAVDSKFWGAVHVAHAASITAGGSLTLVSGMLGVRPSGKATVLSAVNAALDTLACALASELAPVRVNCVAPGRIDTEWWDYLPSGQRDALLERTAEALPVGRVGQPQEIAATIVHCMLNGFLTGSVLSVDGGGSIA
ncbi:SDR family oxidoreductase [Nitratireductor mangrovi]|uniref:SDR family oxidoreductase n=1 Tax=Nitratireductor mangrovi TaxID=2599600 RepID=A0A5B8L658_9HYPH|nr:SDR family oxidoreductase [Nitratireductor mangrovi]